MDRASVEIDREEGKSRLVETQVAFFLEGWVPEERWDQLRQALSDYPVPGRSGTQSRRNIPRCRCS